MKNNFGGKYEVAAGALGFFYIDQIIPTLHFVKQELSSGSVLCWDPSSLKTLRLRCPSLADDIASVKLMALSTWGLLLKLLLMSIS